MQNIYVYIYFYFFCFTTKINVDYLYKKYIVHKITLLVMLVGSTESTLNTVIIPLSNADFISVLPVIKEWGTEC